MFFADRRKDSPVASYREALASDRIRHDLQGNGSRGAGARKELGGKQLRDI